MSEVAFVNATFVPRRNGWNGVSESHDAQKAAEFGSHTQRNFLALHRWEKFALERLYVYEVSGSH